MAAPARHAVVTGGARGIGRAIAGRLVRDGATVTILGRKRRGFAACGGRGRRASRAGPRRDGRAGGRPRLRGDRRTGADRHPRGQCRGGGIRPLRPQRAGAVPADARREPVRHRPRRAGRAAGHDRERLRPDRRHRLNRGPEGLPLRLGLLRAKHAVVGLVRSLAQETARSGITVNAVCPGFTDTDIVGDSLERIMATTGRDRDAAWASLVRHNQQGRLVRPEEVADAVAWLCGAAAGAVTGQAIPVAAERCDRRLARRGSAFPPRQAVAGLRRAYLRCLSCIRLPLGLDFAESRNAMRVIAIISCEKRHSFLYLAFRVRGRFAEESPIG